MLALPSGDPRHRVIRTRMNDTRNAPSTFAPGPWVLAVLILLAALSRLLPHPPNFSPVEAIALFGGAFFASRALAVVVPLAAMLVADVALGLVHGGLYAGWFGTTGFWLVYLCIAASVVLGFGLRGRTGSARVLGYGLVGSVLFFAVTNFGAWLASPVYPPTGAGLLQAYVAGIPFFQWTVLGTLAYAALLFGGFALLRARLPVLRAATV